MMRLNELSNVEGVVATGSFEIIEKLDALTKEARAQEILNKIFHFGTEVDADE